MLLGSYDKKTKSVLNSIKQEISRVFSGKIFVAVLANLDVYDTEKFQVLTETNEDAQQISLFIIDKDFEEAFDLPLYPGQDKSQIVRDFLKEKYNISTTAKQPVAFKLDSLLTAAMRIFLIREKTETRGGEYIELMHALSKNYAEKIWFFKKENVKASSMLMEYLDLYQVIMRPYSNLSELILSITRNIEYALQEPDGFEGQDTD